MHKTILALLFILFSTVSFCQEYVVTLKSDTVVGDVKLLSYDLMDRIQVSQNKKKTLFTAMQVRRVCIKGEQFAPVKFDNSIRLMKVIRSGFLSLYGHRGPGQAGFDTRILQKIGQKSIEVPNIGFKRIIGDIVEDCPSVADRVKNGNLDRSSMEDLVDQYNACIANVNQERIVNATDPLSPVEELINSMKSKVSASDMANKNDVNDLLTSIGERHKKKEQVPVYMKEGLKGYLAGNDDLKVDMEKLFTLIDQ